MNLENSACSDKNMAIELVCVSTFTPNGTTILTDVSFGQAVGQQSIVYGDIGSGKTNLMNLLSSPSSLFKGQVLLMGHNISQISMNSMQKIRRHIGYVWQENRFIEHMTVLKNLSLPLIARGKAEHHYHSDVMDLLAWLGLGKYKNMLPGELSPGQRQHLAIARAVIHRPDMLILDEPLRNLDSASEKRIFSMLTEITQMGCTALWATSQKQHIEALGWPVYTIEKGKIAQQKKQKNTADLINEQTA